MCKYDNKNRDYDDNSRINTDHEYETEIKQEQDDEDLLDWLILNEFFDL